MISGIIILILFNPHHRSSLNITGSQILLDGNVYTDAPLIIGWLQYWEVCLIHETFLIKILQ